MPVSGLDLGNKRVLRIEPGDLVFNNVFAWEGAVAVAGPSEAGTIGSHRFITFRPRVGVCDVRYLQLYFRRGDGLDIARRASPGSAGRNRTLGIERFLRQAIPLPPLAEQRRIVAKIEQLAAKIDEARGLRHDSSIEASTLIQARLNALVDTVGALGTLEEVLIGKPRNGWSARCDNAEGGTPVLSLSAVTGYQYDSAAFKRAPTVSRPAR